MKNCSVAGCVRKYYAKEYCELHYRRVRLTGSETLLKYKPYDRRGDKNPLWKGGKSQHPLYLVYHDMVARCRRKTHLRYDDYGGRGIDVCQEWVDDFWQFVSDVGERPDERKTPGGRAFWSLDRINNDGNYEPGNVRWATQRDQSLNTRERKRVTVCRRGHEMKGDNVVWHSNGTQRRCRECCRINEHNRARSRQRRGEI